VQCFTSLSTQYRLGYMGDGFYRSKDPTNSIKVLKEKCVISHLAKNNDSRLGQRHHGFEKV